MKRENTLTFIIIILYLFTQDTFAQKMALQEKLTGNGRSFSKSSNPVFENEELSHTENHSNYMASEEPENPVYLLGDATTVGWDNNNALEMEHVGDGVFEIVADIVEGPYIKFISVLGQWTPQWGTDETGTSLSGPLVYQASDSDPDVEIAIPAPLPGQYLIQADTVNLVYNITPLFDTFTLTFNVSNEDGIAVDDATIMLHGNTIYEPGEYVIEGLTEENVSYTIWRTGYANQSGSLQIEQNTEIAITLASLPSGNSNVYLLGDATSVGWNNESALLMNHLGNGIFEIVTEIINQEGYIKFISVLGEWAPQWGTNETGTSVSGPLVYRPIPDVPDPVNIPAPVPGTYRISADVMNLEYSIEPFTLHKITFVVLDANNDPIPDARILLNGQPYSEGEYVFEGMEPGNYYYTVWKDGMTFAQNTFELNNEDITITEVLHVIPEEDYRFYLLGDATSAGWDNQAGIEMQSMGEGVFQTDVEIVEGDYIKFISVAGQWEPQWGTDANGTSSSGELIYQPDPFVPTPEAIPAPPPGLYQITADTIQNTYSVTPLFDTFTLTFNVSNEDGIAVDDATIMLHGNTIYEPGEYVIEGLTEENVSYTIWRTGYANQSGSLQIEQNTEIAITLASLPSGNSNVYLLGDATSVGWNNESALLMNHLGNGIFEIVTEIINQEGYIKFISVLGEWAPQWGTNETGTSVSGPLVYRPIPDVPDPVNIPAPVPGTYRISADVMNLEYSIEPFTLHKITFVVLDANNDPIPDARILLNGQPYSEGEYVFEGMEPGNYYYTVWKDGMTFAQNTFELNNEDITITEVLHVIPEEDYRFYLLGDATSAGWDNQAGIEMQSMGEGVFQTDVEIVEGDYIKFISVAGQWEPQWGTDANGTSSSGELIYQPDPFVPTPEAIPAPPPGLYQITADTIQNTYSVTELTTGILLHAKEFVNLYPNPARDKLYVESSSSMTSLAIHDINGKVVYEKEVHGKNTAIAISGLSPGVYILHIYNPKEITTKKVVVER